MPPGGRSSSRSGTGSSDPVKCCACARFWSRSCVASDGIRNRSGPAAASPGYTNGQLSGGRRRKVDRPTNRGLHVALIMDGNGRWAQARGLPRSEGHGRGAGAVRRAVEAAPGLGITTLTLYAFSADNWRRPVAEVSTLMRLLGVLSCPGADQLPPAGRPTRADRSARPVVARAGSCNRRDGGLDKGRDAALSAVGRGLLGAFGDPCCRPHTQAGRTLRRRRIPAPSEPSVPLRSGNSVGRLGDSHEW